MTAKLILFAALALPIYGQVTLQLVDSGRVIKAETTRTIEALEIFVSGGSGALGRFIDFDRPVVQAGIPAYFPSGLRDGATSVKLLSLAYSDGGGGGTAKRMVVLRDQIAAGGPMYSEECDCGEATAAVLVRRWLRLHPLAREPRTVEPGASYPWFNAGSMTVFAFVNFGYGDLPISTAKDWAGNPGINQGCDPDCALQVTASANCPANANHRVQISAYAGNADWCPYGSAGYSASQNINSGALYGYSGIGSSDPTQRYGLAAYESISFSGFDQFWSEQIDSCGFPYVQQYGSGGSGGCNIQ